MGRVLYLGGCSGGLGGDNKDFGSDGRGLGVAPEAQSVKKNLESRICVLEEGKIIKFNGCLKKFFIIYF